jgi:hypothetical protein
MWRLFRNATCPGNRLIGGLIFILFFLVFRFAPQYQVSDSGYSMLLSENLLRHGDFALERYNLPRPDWRLQDVGQHRYYAFSPGTSLLSIPYIAVMRLAGGSVIRGDRSYDFGREIVLQVQMAALLMAAYAVIIYASARLLLPISWSLLVAFVCSFGTQIFSTMSRGMWSDTWGVLLVGLAAFLLLESATRKTPTNLPLLATIEAWAYIVRPTNSLVLAGTALFLATKMRTTPWRFLITAGGWLGLFFVYSWRHFHQLVPPYFSASRLEFSGAVAAMLGNLVSPSRGLLVCVPLVVAIGFLLIRYRSTLRYRPLLALAGGLMSGHLVVLAGFGIHWWGGWCYGARLTGSLVPWIVVLAIIAIDAGREAHARVKIGATGPVVFTGVLAALSIAFNSVGAFSAEAANWNESPDIDKTPERLWSWRRPQVLASFVDPIRPFLPLAPYGLPLGSADAEQYLGLGWSFPEGSFRWTDGSHASVQFSAPGTGPGFIELDLRPYLGGGKIAGQRVVVSLNGKTLQSLNVRKPELAAYEIAVPGGVLQAENRLRLELPNASSPATSEGASDRRELGVAVHMIRWREGR